MAEEDRRRLVAFLDQLQSLIAQDIERNLDRDLRRHAEAAWPRIIVRFDELREALRDSRYDEALERHGLTGAELDLKLFAFNRAVQESAAERGERPRGFWDRVMGVFRSIGGWFRGKWRKFARLILTSLADATGMAGPISELTDVLGISLEG